MNLTSYKNTSSTGINNIWDKSNRGNESLHRPLTEYPWRRLIIGCVLLAGIALLTTSQGTLGINPLIVAQIFVEKLPFVNLENTWPDHWEVIIWKLRLPRTVLAILVGSALAMSGSTYQGLFRNPLAAPSLIGASSGAGLGAMIVMLTGVPLYFAGFSLVPIAAFAGAVTSVTVAYVVARGMHGTSLTTLILAGVAIGSFTSAVTGLVMLRSDPDLRPILSWLLGGFINAQWQHSLIILPYLVPSFIIALAYSRILNILHLDEEHAQQLGVNVERTKMILIAAATLATAAAVSVSGLIGFVGIVAPHAVRLIWGSDYRFLLPMASIVGAIFLVVADLAARTIASPGELPVGIVTAFCGAPFFIYLLRRSKNKPS